MRAFRDAVAEADVEVVSAELDVCGVVEPTDDLLLLRVAEQSVLRLRDVTANAGSRICVEGRLDDRVEPSAVHVKMMRPWQ